MQPYQKKTTYKVKKGSITNPIKERKRAKERKLMRKIGIHSKHWNEHKEAKARKQKAKT